MTSEKKKKEIIKAKYKQSDIIQSRRTFWHMAMDIQRLLKMTLHAAALREEHASTSPRAGDPDGCQAQPRVAPRPQDSRPLPHAELLLLVCV